MYVQSLYSFYTLLTLYLALLNFYFLPRSTSYGPRESDSLPSSSFLKITKVPKLKDDGSNWGKYKDLIWNTIVTKGRRRHARGTVKEPPELELRNGVYYLPNRLIQGGDRTFSATGRGDLKVPLPMGDGEKPTHALLTNAYYSPHLAFTLLSVSCLDRKGWIIHFEDGTCTLGTARPTFVSTTFVSVSRPGTLRFNTSH
ncbi:hypothetical protein B0H11DRAFT_2227273 [Mycena galericulata]|nr:hypothetical protein B0H11DRAFT_2227273 [Mycena galericulata]